MLSVQYIGTVPVGAEVGAWWSTTLPATLSNQPYGAAPVSFSVLKVSDSLG
jgi:hypothetical protein